MNPDKNNFEKIGETEICFKTVFTDPCFKIDIDTINDIRIANMKPGRYNIFARYSVHNNQRDIASIIICHEDDDFFEDNLEKTESNTCNTESGMFGVYGLTLYSGLAENSYMHEKWRNEEFDSEFRKNLFSFSSVGFTIASACTSPIVTEYADDTGFVAAACFDLSLEDKNE